MMKCSGNRRYTYVHDCDRSLKAIDIHHVIVDKTRSRGPLMSLLLVLVLANALYLLLAKVNFVVTVLWSFLFSGLVVIFLSRKSVVKESVIIIPAFGVQLETHYSSGRTVCRFILLDKILKPVLSECVTPVSCYWSLSLILHGEEELLLVFKELRPPMKMLVPIWKALCAARDNNQRETTVEQDT